ncbi:MAG TPA: helix-turn-helix domain-containing protein [Solirubrobacteraceae bacterium]|jgi:AcrR family transcriptional regulator
MPVETSAPRWRHGRAGEGARENARTRILEAAYALFSRHGVHAVGIDRIIAEAPVAKATLYHHFASKQDLVCAFLELRERRWTLDWLQAETERRARDERERALVVFDLLEQWFRRPDFEGCPFINTMLETSDGSDHVVRRAAIRHLDVVRGILERYARQAGAANPADLGGQLQMLMMGAIVSASRGEVGAARQARGVAELLIARGG